MTNGSKLLIDDAKTDHQKRAVSLLAERLRIPINQLTYEVANNWRIKEAPRSKLRRFLTKFWQKIPKIYFSLQDFTPALAGVFFIYKPFLFVYYSILFFR